MKVSKTVVLFLLAVFKGYHGKPRTERADMDKRILGEGGHFVNDYSKFKSYVRVFHWSYDQSKYVDVCGGVLIAKTIVLTHASCTLNPKTKSFAWKGGELAVNAGDFTWPSNDESGTSQGKQYKRGIECIYFHRDYEMQPDRWHENQLALIQLEWQNGFEETDAVAPIRECTDKDHVLRWKTYLKSVGMGQWEEGKDRDECTKLRQMDVELEECGIMHIVDPYVYVCYKAEETCHAKGDEGSPTYLFNMTTDEPICVYSIFYGYEFPDGGCRAGARSVHAKLRELLKGDSFSLDRRNCGAESCISYGSRCDVDGTVPCCATEANLDSITCFNHGGSNSYCLNIVKVDTSD